MEVSMYMCSVAMVQLIINIAVQYLRVLFALSKNIPLKRVQLLHVNLSYHSMFLQYISSCHFYLQTLKSLSSNISKLKETLSSATKTASIKSAPPRGKRHPSLSSPTAPTVSLQEKADQLRNEVHLKYLYTYITFLFITKCLILHVTF